MFTVNEVKELTGVSVRTLHYYDELGLLVPHATTDAGYRLYNEQDLERLQHILLFRELEFPLADIKRILDARSFDRREALESQIELLKLKKEHVETLIASAQRLLVTGEMIMDFDAFDTKKLDEYAKQAKERWGETDAYKEFEQRAQGQSKQDYAAAGQGLMDLFVEFGQMKDGDPAGTQAQDQVKKLQSYISNHFYTCTDEILSGLGQMYVAGGEMTDNIDNAGGPGTAQFASEAIAIYSNILENKRGKADTTLQSLIHLGSKLRLS